MLMDLQTFGSSKSWYVEECKVPLQDIHLENAGGDTSQPVQNVTADA